MGLDFPFEWSYVGMKVIFKLWYIIHNLQTTQSKLIRYGASEKTNIDNIVWILKNVMVLFKHYKPTNPVFDDYVSRLATFDGWGDDVKQTPDMLAEAGFFFIGMSTKIIGKCQEKEKEKKE